MLGLRSARARSRLGGMDALFVRAPAFVGVIFGALAVSLTCALATGVGQKPPKKPVPKPEATKPSATAPAPLDPWRGKLDAAKASAKERNVPLVIHILLDGEESTPRYVKDVLDDPDLVRKSAECIVIVSNNGTHPSSEVDAIVDGQKTKRKACSILPMFTSCSQHQASWDGLYALYKEENGVLRCPQTFVLGPNGDEVLRVNSGQPPEAAEVVAAITAAQAKFGPGLTQAQLDQVRKDLEAGKALMASKSYVEAYKTYAAVLAVTTRSAYGEEAAREQPKALSGMQADLERIATSIVPGNAVKGYQELVEFAKNAVGTPLEKDALDRLKKVDSDKAVHAEIAAWKLSVEADGILGQARDLFDKKQDKQAEKLVRKLVGKRYAATPASQTARKLWPEIAQDEDAKTPPAPK
jgi:hypothetical protein